MADTGSGLDARDGCIFYTGSDQTCAAARNQQIDEAGSSHQFPRAGAIRIFYKSDQFRRESRICKSQMNGIHNGGIGAESFLSAAEHGGIAGFQRKDRCV